LPCLRFPQFWSVEITYEFETPSQNIFFYETIFDEHKRTTLVMSPSDDTALALPSVSEWIAQAISDTGCRIVYGGHGGALVPLVNAVCSHPSLTWVCARNEHDAATMAAAHAKLTGRLGVVLATSGPGATNLVTGLMEAEMDRVSLLAITGMKPTAQLGYAEFQDVNQSRLFSAAGIEWSKDVASVDGVIPLLRDAVATALTRRSCAHLAIPVDIQAAPSPLPFQHFCASHANVRTQPPHVDHIVIDETAETLVGRDTKLPRNIIVVGLRGCFSERQEDNVGASILELAEALNAPILTRLDAKGVIDEMHPLSFGVVGVHGKPGMEQAATLISSSDRVISIGVDDETLLVCNLAGLQIRKVIEIEPDAFGLSTRFTAEHSLVGNITEICMHLATKVEILRNKRKKKAEIAKAVIEKWKHQENTLVHPRMNFDYMNYQNPNRDSWKSQLSTSLPEIDSLTKDAERLWSAFHEGDVSILDRNMDVSNQISDMTCLSGQVYLPFVWD
jgi:thiamine pyrophosphate-dependent acetolactate synthase large subunit-like protein